MTILNATSEPLDPTGPTPTIELGIFDTRGQEGFILRAPPDEALVWDLDNEVGSARRRPVEGVAGWWVDASYLETVIAITLRSFPSVLLLHGPGGDRLLSRDGVAAVQERLL